MVPRRILSRLAPAAVLAVVAGLAGCGDDDLPSDDSSAAATTEEPTTEPPIDEPTSEPTDDETETEATQANDVANLEIEIEEGEVTPTAKQVEVKVGTIVLFEVDSDTPEELHIHSAPEEKTFGIQAKDDQSFKLEVEQPGQFDVELHESGTLVAQLVVRP